MLEQLLYRCNVLTEYTTCYAMFALCRRSPAPPLGDDELIGAAQHSPPRPSVSVGVAIAMRAFQPLMALVSVALEGKSPCLAGTKRLFDRNAL